MKVPKRINEIIKRKQAFIDTGRDQLEKSVIRLQSRLLDEYISLLIPELDIKDGVIQESVKNYRLLSGLDKVYMDFAKVNIQPFLGDLISTTAGIAEMNTNYFQVMLSEIPDAFEKIVAATTKKMNLRIGVEGGKMIAGGFLDSFMKDNTLSTQVKNYVSKSITGQIDTKDFIQGLSEIVNGKDKGPGNLEKQYQRFAYDLYQQYDAAYNSSLGEEFGMTYFMYSRADL